MTPARPYKHSVPVAAKITAQVRMCNIELGKRYLVGAVLVVVKDRGGWGQGEDGDSA